MADRVRIQANEKPASKIFSNDYAFVIPNFQRPYSWGIEQAGELLDDLILAAFDGGDKPYFMGSIVLVKDEGDPSAEVIDGQQRLITLTILLSVLRHLLPKEKETLTHLIYEKGDYILGTKERFRVSLRSRDQDFFQNYIQRDGQISNLPKDAILSDSQSNVRDNALLFKVKLEQDLHDSDKYTKLARYIAQYSYLVVVETSDQESAFRVFSVLNNRGLPLQATDILKAEIIGAILDRAQQEQYSKKWEDIEENLGRESFEQLFSQLRMVFVKDKARRSVLAEIRDKMKPTQKPVQFIDETLSPYADAYYDISKHAFEAKTNAKEINQLLRWLNQFDNDTWMAPAIVATKMWGPTDTDKLLRFLLRLERLAFTMYALRWNVNERIEKYSKVLTALETGENPSKAESGLGLKPIDKSKLVEVLSGPIYLEKCARYVLLRLDEHLSEGEASYDYPVITIEHVLPQTPKPESKWLDLFDEDARTTLTNCLGNLVLLSRRKNSSAQNFDFATKKQKYFGDSATSFSLTKRAVEEKEWTPTVLKNRQKQLIQSCKEIWKLDD